MNHWRKVVFLTSLLVCSQVPAKVPASQAAQLGKSLTPIGAVQAGNADGSIPAWTGGLTSAPPDFKEGGHLVNPFPDDKPLYTITAANYKKYKNHLTVGQIALLTQYPGSFSMPVYRTRRTAAFPQFMYDETVKNATRATLTDNGNGIGGTVHGFPFPIPQNGQEAMWNHILRYNTTGYRGIVDSAVTSADGDYVLERSYFEFIMRYNRPSVTLENFDNKNQFIFYRTISPPSKAGDSYLVHVPLDRIADKIGAWVYNTGLRRVRRIGRVGYDNPVQDGLMTQDQIDMFNGPMDRYSFKLLGKKEIYIPYNNYDLYSPKHSYKEIIQPGHINTQLARYELHRVWVVEANIKPEYSHVYAKRFFYIDEDSWQIVLEDMYDQRGEFWRTSESYAVMFYQVPVMVNQLQVHYDLQSRRYVVLNMTNEEDKPLQFNWDADPSHFSPLKLQRFATAPINY